MSRNKEDIEGPCPSSSSSSSHLLSFQLLEQELEESLNSVKRIITKAKENVLMMENNKPQHPSGKKTTEQKPLLIDLVDSEEELFQPIKVENMLGESETEGKLFKPIKVENSGETVSTQTPKAEIEDIESEKEQEEDETNNGFIQLTNNQIRNLAKGNTCVKFIGELIIGSYPKNYFLSHRFANITRDQLSRLFDIVASTFSKIKRGSRPEVKLSFKEFEAVAKNKINNFRHSPRQQMKYGLNSADGEGTDVFKNLSPTEVDRIGGNCSCVAFIGRLLTASYPEGYFKSHTFKAVTATHFRKLYDTISGRFSTIHRHHALKEVPLTKEEVARVIRNKITNLRANSGYPV